MRKIVIVIGLLLVMVAPALASLQITVHDPTYHITLSDLGEDVRFDWAAGAIFVTSQAKSPLAARGAFSRDAARKAAQARAKYLLESMLSGVKLTSYATVGEMVRCHILSADILEHICNNLHPVTDGWDEEAQSLTMVSVLSFTGPNSPSELIARVLTLEQQALEDGGKSPAHPIDKRALHARPAMKQLSAGPYTGVIIDCRGLHYTPTFVPTFLAPDGTDIWGVTKINTLMVMEKGLIGYADSIPHAIAGTRAGAAPYLLTPLGTAGALHGDLVLSPEDITMLQSKNTVGNLLAGQSVVLVID